MDLRQDLREKVLQKRFEDNMALIPLNNRYFVVTQEQLDAVGPRLLGYNLVTSEDDIPVIPEGELRVDGQSFE